MLPSEIVLQDVLPPYFENFIPVYGESRHNLRNRDVFIYLI